MMNYFNYIQEASQEPFDDEDLGNLVTEMDLTLAEFDSYVQEGVGVKILIGLGIAAALAGLIALLIKLFSGSSSSGAATATNAAKKEAKNAERKGVTKVNCRKFLKREVIEAIDELIPMITSTGELCEVMAEAYKEYTKLPKNSVDAEDFTVNKYGDRLEKLYNVKHDKFDKLFGNKVNMSNKDFGELFSGTVINNTTRDISDVIGIINDAGRAISKINQANKGLNETYAKIKAYDKDAGWNEFAKELLDEDHKGVLGMIQIVTDQATKVETVISAVMTSLKVDLQKAQAESLNPN